MYRSRKSTDVILYWQKNVVGESKNMKHVKTYMGEEIGIMYSFFTIFSNFNYLGVLTWIFKNNIF